MLSPQRADSYSIGLKSVGHYIILMIAFYQHGLNLVNNPQYKSQAEDACITHWEKMREGGLTEGTIRCQAKKDNPSAYAQFLEDINTEILKQCKSKGGHRDIACCI